ncbi:MAG: hypothetical protein IPM97_00760 [Bdellovibrionaceae bacterium]|nr:hypothetical protein [Pseudobdellovibrionaceae bacterium]
MSRKNTRKRKIRFKVNYSKMPRCLFAGKLKLRPKIAVSLLIHPGSIRRTWARGPLRFLEGGVLCQAFWEPPEPAGSIDEF